MLVVSCRRQGMLTQGPAPYPKCKLNISCFLKLLHLLDSLICTRNSVSIVLLLWMMAGWDRTAVVDSYQGVCWGTGGGYYPRLFFICSFAFCCLMSSHLFNWVEHHSYCVCLFGLLFVFFVSCFFNQEPLEHRNCCVCNVTQFIKWKSDHSSVDFLGKERVF